MVIYFLLYKPFGKLKTGLSASLSALRRQAGSRQAFRQMKERFEETGMWGKRKGMKDLGFCGLWVYEFMGL